MTNFIDVRNKEESESNEYQIKFGEFGESIMFSKCEDIFKITDTQSIGGRGEITICVEDIDYLIDALMTLKQLKT